jgi:hypothetical protein
MILMSIINDYRTWSPDLCICLHHVYVVSERETAACSTRTFTYALECVTIVVIYGQKIK